MSQVRILPGVPRRDNKQEDEQVDHIALPTDFHRRLLTWIQQEQGLVRWSVLAIAVGIAAGVGAIGFFWLLEQSTAIFLGHLVGYLPPAPFAEGNHPPLGSAVSWKLPLVVALGGLLSGLLVFSLAPEAEGHGTDAAIESFHFRDGKVRGRVIPVKVIASAITIGTGGSGGREGPTAQIAAGIGSLIAEILGLSPTDRRLLLATGMGAGIGAIFRAPLGGALLSAEILYLHDFEVEALFPALIASIVGYTIYSAWAGWEPIFGARPDLALTSWRELPAYGMLGFLCGLVGRIYATGFYAVQRLFSRLPLPRWAKPALGGLLVGGIGLVFPQVLGTGYGWVQLGMESSTALQFPIWLLLALPLLKILATALSIGSGGSGGIFGPGVVIGAFVGIAWWRLLDLVGGHAAASPAPYAIVGMMALFGSIAHAPLAVMLMVAEMTGNLSLLAPAMLAIGLASVVVGQQTIYRSQLPRRADSPAHRLQYTFPLLHGLSVRDAIQPAPLLLHGNTPLNDAARQLQAAHLPDALVIDEHGTLLGIVTLQEVHEAATHLDRGCVADITQAVHPLPATMPLDEALAVLLSHHRDWLPAIDATGTVLGILHADGILKTYQAASRRAVRQLHWMTSDRIMLEVTLPADSPLVGRAIRELSLPKHVLLIAVRRGGTLLLPRGETRLEAGDTITFVTERHHARTVLATFGLPEQALVTTLKESEL